MISNERQLANAREKLTQLRAAVEELSEDDAIAFQDLAAELQRRVDDYVAARDGLANVFKISDVDGLASAVIRARVARGWTQKQLAEELEVSEQMVQRDEARQYENVGLAKLGELLDALEYELVGQLRPRFLPVEQWRGDFSASTAKAACPDYAFTQARVLVMTQVVHQMTSGFVRFADCSMGQRLNDSFSWDGIRSVMRMQDDFASTRLNAWLPVVDA